MKKYLLGLIIFVTIILSSCGTSTKITTSLNLKEFKQYGSELFAIYYPNDWNIKIDFDDKYPKNVLASFLESNSDKGFTSNINILKENLNKNLDNISFAKDLTTKNSKDLIAYKKIGEETIKLKVAGKEQDTMIEIFDGKNKSDGDTFRFMQVYLVKDTTAYIVTGTMLNNADKTILEKVETSLKTFELK